MTRTHVITLATAALLFFAGFPAHAAEGKGTIVLESFNEVEVVVENDKGEKVVKKVDAAKARILPGDEVLFSVRFRNTGTEPADDIVITNPVPEYMTLKPVTIHGEFAEVTLSIDSGKSFGSMDELFVLKEDGSRRPPKPEEYTHVRWAFSKQIMPGEQGSVGFTAIVE